MNTRTFALILGIILLLAGIAGFIPGLVSHGMETMATGTAAPGDAGPAPATAASYGYLLGLFPTNAIHNLVHIVWGLYGIVAYRSFAGARSFAKATAVVYAILTIAGLIPGLNTLWGIVPLFGHDIWLHALITIAAAYFGFARAVDTETVTATTGPTSRV
ncbi:DUF4383 domain-containing protein [Benzoatithermus flavus]|uniref:DUF4383 domain-containing protein n=1 Tax=Benzoatithermus flavus TaxID=3108223 RepID=A0ABU8XQC2_9PROT